MSTHVFMISQGSTAGPRNDGASTSSYFEKKNLRMERNWFRSAFSIKLLQFIQKEDKEKDMS